MTDTELTDFTIGGRVYRVPPMNLLASRLYSRSLPPLYVVLRGVIEEQKQAISDNTEVALAPMVDAQSAIVDAQIEVLACRLESTAEDPAQQDEPGATTYKAMTADRIKAIMRHDEQEPFEASMQAWAEASGYRRKAVPEGETQPAAPPPATPTPSSTTSSSQRRGKASKAARSGGSNAPGPSTPPTH